MIIRSADLADKECIFHLWKEAFGDSDDYIHFFMKYRFQPQLCRLLEHNREIVGMVHLLPCTLYPEQKAYYWYAACIKKSMRGRSLFRQLATSILQENQSRGFANVCVPAPGLAGVYQKLGFSHPFFGTETEFFVTEAAINLESVSFSQASAEDFLSQSHGVGDTIWSECATRYAMMENQFCDGFALKCNIHSEEMAFFAIQKDESTFLIDNHRMSIADFSQISQSLCRYLNCKKLILRTPGGTQTIGLSDCSLVNGSTRISMTLE